MIYTIKYAENSDFFKIQSFIEKHWKQNHILSHSKKLFDFQHLNPLNQNYNFIIAVNNTTTEIDALLGFIPTYQYDKELFRHGDYWGAIWKVRTDVQNVEIKNLGLSVWEKLFELDNFQSWAAIGISEIAKKIYAISGMQVGELAHYYLPNTNIAEFHIADNIDIKQTKTRKCPENITMKELHLEQVREDINCSYRPKKSISYLKNRYLNHPFYQYRFWGIFDSGRLVSIWVLRVIEVNNSKAIRVVDMLGNIENVPCLSAELQKVLVDIGAEYIDILNYGINEEAFLNIGFYKLDPTKNVIIPNYFEPFERRNIKIEFAYKADFDYIIFKGDADQDRPNFHINERY